MKYKIFFSIISVLFLSTLFAQSIDCDYFLKMSDSLLSKSYKNTVRAKKYLHGYTICLNGMSDADSKIKLKNLENYEAISLSGNKKGGWAMRKSDLKIGIIDEKFNWLSRPAYSVYYNFNGKNFCLVKTEDGKSGIIDYTGSLIIPISGEKKDICSQNEDLIWVQVGDKYGFYNNSCKKVVDFKYDEVGSFSEGFIRVIRNDKVGFVSRFGTELISCQYEDAADFTEGYACVRKNGFWGFVDNTGKLAIPVVYEEVGSFSAGLAPFLKANRWGFMNQKGDVVIQAQYTDVGPFYANIAPARKNLWGLINKNGIFVLPPQYDFISNFYEGYAYVRKDNKFGYIDSTGKSITSIVYYNTGVFSNGLAAVAIKDTGGNEKWGYIDQKGKVVIPIQYDYAHDFKENGLAIVEINEEEFFINKNGQKQAY